MSGQHAGPKVERVRVLPVINGFIAIFPGLRGTRAKVDCELPNVGKAGCITDDRVKAPKLSGGILHEINAGEGVSISDTTAADEPLIGCLKNSLTNRSVTYDGKTADHEESIDLRNFVAGRFRPYVNDGLDEALQDFFE